MQTGCSSARLEYTSGGRVVASSNLVIPTKLSKQRSSIERLGTFCFICHMMLASRGIENKKRHTLGWYAAYESFV